MGRNATDLSSGVNVRLRVGFLHLFAGVVVSAVQFNGRFSSCLSFVSESDPSFPCA